MVFKYPLRKYSLVAQISAKKLVRSCEKFLPALAWLLCLTLHGFCLAKFAYFLAEFCRIINIYVFSIKTFDWLILIENIWKPHMKIGFRLQRARFSYRPISMLYKKLWSRNTRKADSPVNFRDFTYMMAGGAMEKAASFKARSASFLPSRILKAWQRDHTLLCCTAVARCWPITVQSTLLFQNGIGSRV